MALQKSYYCKSFITEKKWRQSNVKWHGIADFLRPYSAVMKMMLTIFIYLEGHLFSVQREVMEG